MSTSPSEIASTFLLDLAHGKYNQEIQTLDEILQIAGATFPAALVAKKVMDTFLQINRLTAPEHVIPDGAGGWVPSTNSRIRSDGSFQR